MNLLTLVIDYMSRLYEDQFRVLLIIDDLDRCQADRIMGVLTAVTLLLEDQDSDTNSPFISLLSIDPRVLLSAIEKHFNSERADGRVRATVNG